MGSFHMNFKTLFYISLFLLFLSCRQNYRQVIPYEIDTDEIYKAVAPNEEDDSQGLTFGKKNIPGFTFDYEMSTDKKDVYIFFEKFTVLDVNPLITENILGFIQEQLVEYGFINQSDSLPGNEFSHLLEQNMSYTDAVARILDNYRKDFEIRLPDLTIDGTPFNAYFLIYPVFINESLVTYRQTAYCYTGGAHGMTISYLKTYDLVSGKELSLDDIILADRLIDVREEVAAHMAYSYPIYENITTVEQYIDSLNVWLDHFDPQVKDSMITLENFPLTDVALLNEGLAFVYQMYYITPGSDGCPVVVIPYKDIKGCLKVQP